MDIDAMMEFYDNEPQPEQPEPVDEPERKPGGFPIVLNIPKDARHPQMTSAIAQHVGAWG